MPKTCSIYETVNFILCMINSLYLPTLLFFLRKKEVVVWAPTGPLPGPSLVAAMVHIWICICMDTVGYMIDATTNFKGSIFYSGDARDIGVIQTSGVLFWTLGLLKLKLKNSCISRVNLTIHNTKMKGEKRKMLRSTRVHKWWNILTFC